MVRKHRPSITRAQQAADRT